MGYYVRALLCKKSIPTWKLQFVSYKTKDVINSNAQKLKKEWDVDPDRWRSLGIHKLMTIEEAKVRAKQLNAQDYLRGQEERIKKLEMQDAELRKRYDSVLPEEFVAEFENRFIKARDSETLQGKRKTSRARVTWKAAQKLIVAVQIDPSEWFYYNNEIYDYFFQKKYSLRYCHSILSLVNRWGYFISRKLAKPFMAKIRPRGYERQRLIEAYYGKTESVRRPSAQLTPEHLTEISQKMNQPNFNWLFISVWFGLRPQEIDNLHDKTLWKLEVPIEGRKILWVFQTKIVALPPEDRWKPIPLLFDEQEFAVRIIQAGNFKRPLVKTIRKYLSSDIDLYGGRKGFSDLMLSRGHAFENISIWMGHSTLERTWKSYKNKRRFHL